MMHQPDGVVELLSAAAQEQAYDEVGRKLESAPAALLVLLLHGSSARR
jgi:hypothetical protein